MSKMRDQFSKLREIVLGQIGRNDFEKTADGKAFLSESDKEKLVSAFSPAFIAKFEQGLDTEVALIEQEAASSAAMEQLKSDNGAAMQVMAEKVNAAQQRADALAAEKAALESNVKTLKQTVEVLSAMPGADDAEVITGKGHGAKGKEHGAENQAWHGIRPNPKHFHTQMAQEAILGNTGKLMQSSASSFGSSVTPGMTGTTINVDEVYNEFGTYLSQTNAKLDILRKLTEKTESQKYMTTKMAITEWRAATAIITSVVQQFIAKWTPLGSSTFSPLTIINRHHKVNLPITPDDINDSWLSYLYDEQMTVDQMPVTRYIIEQLLRPRIESDIEMLLIATGTYEALGPVNENAAGQATGKSMDGYVTILKNEYATGTSNMNFFTPSVALDKDSVVDVIEEYSDWVETEAPLYAKLGMNLFIDPVIYKWFKRKYRELYPTTKNEDKGNDVPDFSKLTFVPLEAMRGTGTFFSTPKENFIRLVHKNAAGGETKLFLQVERYSVMVFAEFWLGVGFALAELVFAYVPAADESGSGR